MRDRSKQLLVINTGKKESEQTRLPAQSGTTHIIGGGGLSVNMSDYLLKSIWDKVFEIRTDGQGTEYIFGKLPMVTQYGITMYSGDGVDIPSLASGLPFDGRTIWYNPDTQQIEVIGGTGGGSGEGVSNFWDLSGIPSWITNSKPKYSYSEIEGTPDLSVYAQVDTLKAYVTLAGAQTLTGEKNFTGGLKVNGSPIIYDSANKYWKLQGNLVLTGGITMYADDGTLNLPSIYDGLPIDGTTIYWDTDAAGNRVIKAVIGGGTSDSVAWVNITGKPTWIGSSKPVYSYSEIQGTPDLSVYALKTQIPSLSGYATESWVTKQNYATKATTLSGYGITDAYTKTNVDDLLKAYVTLSGSQTITGEKNFTGGLKVNGSPIYYDSTKKYWKLEGDLLVTGGVTMYGNDSSFTPSTIMDAILYDSATLGINSNGQLYVKGGAGGGINTTDLQNYLTQNSYLNVTSGDNRYLKLGGGTLSGDIVFQDGYLRFTNSSGSFLGAYNVNDSGEALYIKGSTWNRILHSGNYSNYALPLSGGTLDGVLTLRASNSYSDSWIEFSNKSNSVVHKIGVRRPESSYGLQYYNGSEYYKIWHEGNDGSDSGLDADLLDGQHLSDILASNVASATKATYLKTQDSNSDSWYDNCLLYAKWAADKADYLDIKTDGYYTRVDVAKKLNTARTLWGQSFDGTSNVSGNLTLENNYEIVTKNTSGSISSTLYRTKSNNLSIGEGIAKESNDTYISGNNLFLRYGTGLTNGISLISSGNVGIGTTSPSYKLDVNGNISASCGIFGKVLVNKGYGSNVGDQTIETSSKGLMLYLQYYHNGGINLCQGGGNVGIGTTSPSYKLDVNGDIATSQYLRVKAWSGYGSGICSMWYNGNTTQLILDSGASFGYHLNVSGDIWMTGAGFTGGGLYFTGIGSGTYNKGSIKSTNIYGYEIEAPRATDSATGTALPIFIGWRGGALGIKITSGGNLLANGGITMYSDQRKKTIINHVELSLKQIADAPLIEHYYNSDEKKTTHVGSIAQYWASMNDWFCKLDSEGYYTMEIQNAALASAISIARELDRYETKTDKAIKKLKKRICELEEEVERLKAS